MHNLADVARLGAMRWPGREAVVYRGRRYTYAEFAELVGGRVHDLTRRGVGRGDAVVTMAGNSDLLLATYLAIAAIGALNIPLNTMTTVDETADVLARTGARLAYYAPEFTAQRDALPERAEWVLLDAAAVETDPAWARAALPTPAGGADEPAMVIFTSGSTARPKGCVKSHSNLIWHIVNAQLGMPRGPLDREVYVIPLAGIGLVNFALLNLLVGATLVLDRFTPEGTLRGIQDERATHCFLPPTMLHAMLSVPDQGTYDLSTLRRVDTGYEMSARLRNAIADRLGPIVHYGYGSSEGTLSYATAPEFMTDPQCVGVVFGLDELAIMDPDGALLGEGQVGEIVSRGPTLLGGYLGDAELTAAALREGWYHSGDLGWLGPGRNLHFAGRLKDMIKTGGLNVSAAEVEQILARHPRVESVSVVGVADDKWGEAVVAAVVPVPGSAVSEAELAAFAAENLAGYKRPKRYLIRLELPVNPSGKVAKGVLRRLAEHELSAAK